MQKNIIYIALATAGILLIPLALQLTIGTGVDGQGFNWKPGDFIVMGALIFITGLLLDFASRMLASSKYRIIICAAIVVAFLLTWAELAVGVFGTPFAGS